MVSIRVSFFLIVIFLTAGSFHSFARERTPASIERKLAQRTPEEQEWLKKLAEATSIHIDVAVVGMLYDGKRMIFTLRNSTPEGKKFKYRTSKLAFNEDSRNPEYEKMFHEIYASGRPVFIGLQMVTKESYQSQFSVIEGDSGGSLNEISGNWITYISVGEDPLK